MNPPKVTVTWLDMSDLNLELIQRCVLDEVNRQHDLSLTSINQIGLQDIEVEIYPNEEDPS